MDVKPDSKFLWLFLSWDEVLLLRAELHDHHKAAEAAAVTRDSREAESGAV